MKYCKSILALSLIVLLLLSLLAACGQAEESTNAGDSNASNTPVNDSNSSQEKPSGNNSEQISTEDIDNIEFYFYDLYNHGDYGQKIIDAVNEITIPLIQVRVDIEWYDMGSYGTQLGLNIAGGTPVDLVSIMPMPATSVAQLHASNQLMEIRDLVMEYAPQTYEMMEPYLNAMTYNGGLYGLPTMKNWANNQYIMMRADVLRELDLYDYAADMSSWQEYEEVLRQVTEAKAGSGMYGLGRARSNSVVNSLMALGYEAFSDYSLYDSCGDTLTLLFSDRDGNIYSYYEDEHTVSGMKLLADWYAKGYIWPDSAFSDTDGDDLVSGNVIFSKMEGGELGVEVRQQANCGTEMLCVKVANGYITTSQLTSWGLAIPVTADEPEAACRFIEQLYTNAELLNLLLMGIEGEDYVVLESGEIDYPEGLDANSVEYHEPDWLFGNQFLVLPWAGNGADYREIAAQENVNSEISPYLGFALDTSQLENVIASLSAVNDQYAASLSCGLYTDELYQQFLDKLYAQGLQDYIDAVQTQLSAFLAAQ